MFIVTPCLWGFYSLPAPVCPALAQSWSGEVAPSLKGV